MNSAGIPLNVKFKIWLEINGKPVLGEGGYHLLTLIEKHGSILKASKELSISYRKALSYIRRIESRLGLKIVETSRGGPGGGGSAKLTDTAKFLVLKYEKALNVVENALSSL